MQVWNVLHAARWKYRTQKKTRKKSPSGHHRTTLSGYIFATKARIDNWKKNFLNTNVSSTCPHNIVNFGPVAAEICWRVWGTPANFNRFRVLKALLHGSLVVGVSQTLRHSTEGTTYMRQGGHHVGHWPAFLMSLCFANHEIGLYSWVSQKCYITLTNSMVTWSSPFLFTLQIVGPLTKVRSNLLSFTLLSLSYPAFWQILKLVV